MPSNKILNIRKRDFASEDAEDARSLLGSASNDNPADVDPDDNDVTTTPRLRPSRRQSPLHSNSHPQDAAAAAAVRTPRTTNRVRFDLTLAENNEHVMKQQQQQEEEEEEEEGDEEERGGANGHLPRYHTSSSSSGSTGQRAPLLTGIEAPSITVANTSVRVNMEELLEDVNRPKSGMLSAFMNMANSIM